MIPDSATVSHAAAAGPGIMVSFAFYAALILSVLKIGEVLLPWIRPPALRVVVTRELIYRILDDTGENFFLNVTLLADRSAVLIESATVTLSKIGETTKRFPLIIRMVGDKVPSPNHPIASHNFYTTSPLAFVAQAQPLRIVYLCAMKDYAARAGHVTAELTAFATKLREDYGGAALAAESVDQKLAIYDELRGRVATGVTEIMETVQLEGGQYLMHLSLTYRRPSGLLRPRRNSGSSITFEMPTDMRALLRAQLITYWDVMLRNHTFGTADAATVPSVGPLYVIEEKPA